MIWTEEIIEILKTMRAEGHSAGRIARMIGKGCTRNAVLGKAMRMGIVGGSKQRPRHSSEPFVKAVKPEPEPIVIVEPAAARDDNGQPYTVMTIRHELCRWPIGDPQQPDFHFCGSGCAPASAYCDAHAARTFTRPQPRRNREDGYAGGHKKSVRRLTEGAA
jgi:GcrA cell cycle regulator